MSYLYSFAATAQSISSVFPDVLIDNKAQSYTPAYLISGFSIPKHPVILVEEGKLKLEMFEWGMIKDSTLSHTDIKKLEKQRFNLLKGRAEKIVGDPASLWHRKRQNRLLIPATGFFEYREVPGFKKKVPYYIHLKDQPLFFMPGLYNYTQLPDKTLIGSFTMISRDGNTAMKSIHNSGDFPHRMPLMLPGNLERKWLDPTLSDQELQSILDFEMPSSSLVYYPVKSLYRANPLDPTLIEPVDYPGLPPVDA